MLTVLLLCAELLARAQTLDKRYIGKCGPSNNAYTSVNSIIACYQYLNKLGNQKCGTSENTILCTAGQAHIYGSALNKHTTSYW